MTCFAVLGKNFPRIANRNAAFYGSVCTLPVTCLHSQVRSCWLKAEVINAAAAGHQESMLGEENVVSRGFCTLSVTFPAWVPFNTWLCLKAWKNPVLAPLRLSQVVQGCCCYLISFEWGLKIASQLTCNDQKVLRAEELLSVVWWWSSLFLLNSQFIWLLTTVWFFWQVGVFCLFVLLFVFGGFFSLK